MKQLVQNLRTGETLLLEVPVPLARKGCILIKSHKSLVSTGTEKMLIEFSKANFLLKARQQPEKLRLILDKIKTDGLWKTTRTVLRRLDQLMSMGYCNVGEIMALGEGVEGFVIGDRVISNGPHAEMVCVPVNLVAKIPDLVPDDEAAFTVLGAVGLHGVRLLAPELGEKVAVIGLGLIGLMVIDLLRAHGCKVIGVEPDENRRGIAALKGIPVMHPENGNHRLFLDRFGEMDGLIISAYTKSIDVISMASAICRKRAKIVLIGDVPLHLNRADFYQKELTFQVSCSYGPGRYDHNYEENGSDYPLPYVRWTENRNFQEILRLLATGALNVKNLITKVVPLTDYGRIYHQMNKSLGILISYDGTCESDANVVANNRSQPGCQKVVAAIIGAGNFVRMTLLPCLEGKYIKYIASSSGLKASELASKHGIPFATSNYGVVLEDDEVNLIIIATRHDSHAKIAAEALRAGKHVFVEKPLSIDTDGLAVVKLALHEAERPVSITVGFNRRHAPHVVKMRELLGDAPMNVVITVNAGHIPGYAWVHERVRGGGRLIGEGCHFIDLIAWITQSSVTAVCTNALMVCNCMSSENVTTMLRMANGSTGVVHYFSNGHTSYPKERVEAHSLGRTLILDDFKVLKGYGFPGFDSLKSSGGKGHKEQFGALFECIESQNGPLMPPEAIWNSSQATLAALDSIWTGGWIKVP